MSYCVGSDMSGADMILDSVGVAKLDEVNLSDMVVSGVIFPEFTWLLLPAVISNKNQESWMSVRDPSPGTGIRVESPTEEESLS